MFQEKDFRKTDVYSISYTDSIASYEFITGKSIENNREREIATIEVNPKEQGALELISFCINKAKSIESRTIAIDYRLLTPEVVEILKDAYLFGNITGIRILPDSQILTRDILRLFDDSVFNDFLITANSSESNEFNHLDVRATNDLCKVEHIIYHTGICHDEYNIIITRKLSREEIADLAEIIKKDKYSKIIVDFYEPMYYQKLLIALQEENIDKDIEVRILANPLYDEAEIYEKLEETIDNKLVIQYNTCNDLNEYHRNEPHTFCANYYSDIEASGKTTVDNYAAMIRMFDEIINNLKEKEYSPLEKVAYIHDYFKHNYHYNFEYEFEPSEANRDLDQVYSRDKMICEGFSNLYSALLRRSGILCFTYGTDDHQKNIIRITDEKYGIDNLALIDPTWDLDNMINRNVFRHFLVPIDNDLYALDAEVINVPTSLVIDNETYSSYINDSNPVYATDPLGYAIRMLQLMGLTCNETGILTIEELSNLYKSALANSNLLERIPDDKVSSAIKYVREREHDLGISDDIAYENAEIERNIHERGNLHTITPRIRLFNGTNVHTKYYIPRNMIQFEEVEDQNARYYRPREIKEGESEQEYQTYLERFYHEMFYSQNNMQQEQQVDIIEPVDEYTEIVTESQEMQDIIEPVKDSTETITESSETKQNIEEYFVVEKIRIFRDINNPNRLFAPVSVFERFHVEIPNTYINVPRRENIYELNKMFAYLILNNNENSYAPYYIEFEDVDINSLEKISNKIEIPEENDLIPGTNFRKPRGRGDYETDEEYVEYLEYYYNSIFPSEEKQEAIQEENTEEVIEVPRPRGIYETDEEYTRYLQDFYGTVPEEELIPGTNFRKPRRRGDYETDEEYVDFLEKYYIEIFGEEVVEKSKTR